MTLLDIRPLAADQRGRFVRMVHMYLTEIAPDLDVPDQETIARYWQRQDRFALILHQDDQMIGFALVTRLPNQTHELSEFYIARAHRRSGLGRQFANDVVSRYPGHWRLGLALGNPDARSFWLKAIGTHAVKRGPPLTPHQSGSLHFTVKETSR